MRDHITLASLAGASVLRWSPDGAILLVGGAADGSFWLYDCLQWAAPPQRWRLSGHSLRSAVWHSSGAWLAVACAGEATVHVLQRTARAAQKQQQQQHQQHLSYGASFALPAAVLSMAASQCGRRLCVALTDGRVAVVDWSRGLRLYAVGFLQGPEGAGAPELLAFKQASTYVLCAVAWATGVITLVPMFLGV